MTRDEEELGHVMDGPDDEEDGLRELYGDVVVVVVGDIDGAGCGLMEPQHLGDPQDHVST